MAASSSSSSGGSFKYDVFINFRGEDTRRSFVCHLFDALKQTALDTFIDSDKLQKGDDLLELFKAIQDSRLSIVVFSKNYASSTWCLKELVQILECMDRQSQIVVPVFYEADPSHVRKLKESFADAFAKHESDSNLDNEELESWKSCLTRATNLSGYDSRNYQDDIQLIKIIVEDILKKLIRVSPSKTDGGLIGMDSHMDEMDSLLKLGVDDYRIVGIWGMGGIGKSTIAKAVYDNISLQFEHMCFLDNVKEGFLTKNGAVQMVEDLLSRLLKISDRLTLDGGLNMMRERLGNKKVLIVLDDVDALEQIETLIGENPSFGDGSRTIITTRDRKLLAGFSVYEPMLFPAHEALKLFRRHAFRTIKYSESYDEISRCVVEYAHGLPLALKVLGGLLDNKTVHEWEYELKKIKKISITFLDDNKIGRVLLASYNGLDEWQKNMFLDIACFFRGKSKEEVLQFHESCGFFPQNGLKVLEEKSLIASIHRFPHSDVRLDMHDLIQEMGRDIIYREFTKDPGRRSRLWYYEDVLQVLAQNTPAEVVEGIVLDLTKVKEVCVNTGAFGSMKNLRILQLTHDTHEFKFFQAYRSELAYPECKQHMTGNLKFLSNELRVFIWHGCPLKSLPSDFQPKNLTKIDMRHSHIEQLWEGTKPLQNLVDMDLSCSKYLIKTPDLTEATNLKKLNLAKCTSLLEVHPSISALKSLVQLELQGCSNLEKFPNVSGNMKELRQLYLDGTAVTEMPSSINDLPALQNLSLRGCRELRSLPSIIHLKSVLTLDLSRCSNLEEFPDISQVMEKLYGLDLAETAIKQLPSSIDNLTGLKLLIMRDCTSLVSLPDEICNLARLEELYLNGCSKFEEFPDISQVMEKLYGLDLAETAIKQLPSSIDNLTGLKVLIMRDCTSLVSLPDEICNLARLEELYLNGCSKFEKLPDNFQNVESLGEDLKNLEGSGIKQLPFGICRMKSLSRQRRKELTAPFSSWPTCMRNPSSSIMVHLDLSDCNVLELSDAIAHLSSLERLTLCRNKHLESLPAAMNRLPRLRVLHLEGCERLKSIPELQSSIQQIKADNCTSLETVSTPKLCCAGDIHFSFFNCFKLVKTNLFMDIVEAAATDNQGNRSNCTDFSYHNGMEMDDDGQEEDHGYVAGSDICINWFNLRHKGYFCYHMSLPGSDISNWFSHQCRGSFVTVQLPPDWSQELAICAISNLRGADTLTTLESAFWCASFKANDVQDNIYFPLLTRDHDIDHGCDSMPIESDHMFLGYLNSLDLEEWHNDRKYTEATFKIVTSSNLSLRLTGYPNASMTWKDCTWITSCGVRLFKNVPSSVDLVCNLENRETEISRKRKRETLERDEETMGEECSRGPICLCVSLSECMSKCSISLRKKQREREGEPEGVTGLESEKADVSGEGGLFTLSL